MENPMTWTPVHRLINEIISQHHKEMKEGVCGLSLPSKIINALQEKGLLNDETKDIVSNGR